MSTTDALAAIADRLEYYRRAVNFERPQTAEEEANRQGRKQAYTDALEVIKDIGGLIQ